MKSKSIIGAALAAVMTLGVTTSCEDMFDIESSRVIVENKHNLNSSADSAYSTVGVLHAMRQIADRYLILGEVRGDLLDINEYTKTSLRNLAEFNFEDENEYLNVRDYYAIINNCNYVLAKMDTTISKNNERVMIDEYAALIGIRAWTYLQLAINYGEVPFYLNPITSLADAEKEYPKKDVKGIAEELIPDLISYMDYDMPAFASGTSTAENVYPPLQLVLADYYLWSGEYANAWETYWDYMTTHPDFNYAYGDETNKETFRGYMGFDGAVVTCTQYGSNLRVNANSKWVPYQTNDKRESLGVITLAPSSASGTVSTIGNLFTSTDKTHSLNPSTYLKELSSKQSYINSSVDDNGKTTYTVNSLAGDVRYKYYLATPLGSEDPENQVYDKIASANTSTGIIQHINIYRRAIVYLRAAEALNGMALEQDSSRLAVMAFNLMKDAYKVFFPEGHVSEKDLREAFIGVHARGCGDVRVDDQYFVLKPRAIAKRLGKYTEDDLTAMTDSVLATQLTLNDTIEYVDELIIDELALESAVEGNRFGDLIRFAKRRQAWAEAGKIMPKEGKTYHDFLAKRVASRKGSEAIDQELYDKLYNSEEYWYLPLK